MRQYQYNEITFLQFVLLIVGTQVGIGILTLPRQVSESAGTDGWIPVIIGWIISVTTSLVIIQVMKRNPEDTLFDMFFRYFGKGLGGFFNVLFILYNLLGVLTLACISIFIIQSWILPNTPNEFLIILFTTHGYLVVRNGVRILGRYAELIFYLTLWMPIIFLMPLKEGHVIHLLPVIKEGWWPIIKTVQSTIPSFAGFEISFILYPFLKDKSKASIGVIIANTLTMLFFLFVIFICFIYFSPDEITNYPYPTLTLIKPIEFAFIERFEIVFLSYYLFVMSTTVLPYLFISAFGISKLFGKQDHRIYLRVIILCLIASTFFFNPTFADIEQINNLVSQSDIIMAYTLPYVLWVYIYLYHLFNKTGIR